MKFKVGQKVELVDAHSMRASLGATAVIYRVDRTFVAVKWKTGSNNQIGGPYYLYRFKPLYEKGKQLEFSFME